jgi:hypothetical protein
VARRGRTSDGAPSNREKGSFVEDVAAAMFRLPGFHVQTRVRVDPRGGVRKRSERREIDVLVTLDIPGLPVPIRIAIECKNSSFR